MLVLFFVTININVIIAHVLPARPPAPHSTPHTPCRPSPPMTGTPLCSLPLPLRCLCVQNSGKKLPSRREISMAAAWQLLQDFGQTLP